MDAPASSAARATHIAAIPTREVQKPRAIRMRKLVSPLLHALKGASPVPNVSVRYEHRKSVDVLKQGKIATRACKSEIEGTRFR